MPLIVTPKVAQNWDKTKKDLNKVNLESLKLSNVITKNNGSVLISGKQHRKRKSKKFN